jgi:hypothetical protein
VRGACAGHACGAVTTRSPRARRRDGALTGGSVAAGRWQDVVVEHLWGPGVTPNKVAEGGADPRVGSMVREGWRRRLDGVPR